MDPSLEVTVRTLLGQLGWSKQDASHYIRGPYRVEMGSDAVRFFKGEHSIGESSDQVAIENRIEQIVIEADTEVGFVAIIASRTDDPSRRAVEGELPFDCVECRSQVMVSPATRERMTTKSSVLCIQCAISVAEDRQSKWIVGPPTEAQRTERRSTWGDE